jgi:hypothetical protein
LPIILANQESVIRKDCNSKPAQANSSRAPISGKKKGGGGLVEWLQW